MIGTRVHARAHARALVNNNTALYNTETLMGNTETQAITWKDNTTARK